MFPDDPTTQEACHARILEGVAKSQFPLKAVIFKSQSLVQTRLKKSTPTSNLEWWAELPVQKISGCGYFDFSRIAGNCVLSVRKWPIRKWPIRKWPIRGSKFRQLNPLGSCVVPCSSASTGLADYSQVDTLGLRHRSVNLGAGLLQVLHWECVPAGVVQPGGCYF